MDEFSGGANIIDEIFDLFKKFKVRFFEGLFNLRKWRLNDSNLREKFGMETNKTLTLTRILGILWDKESILVKFEFKEILKLPASLELTKQNEKY